MAIQNIKSTNRKKYKRATNALVREFNKGIKEDWLWNGRFVMSQEEAHFYPYEDKSGGEYFVHFLLTDTKTGKVEHEFFNNYNMYWKIYEWVNKCIVETWDVWHEKPNPNEQARLEGRHPSNMKGKF